MNLLLEYGCITLPLLIIFDVILKRLNTSLLLLWDWDLGEMYGTINRAYCDQLF